MKRRKKSIGMSSPEKTAVAVFAIWTKSVAVVPVDREGKRMVVVVTIAMEVVI